MGTTSQEAPNAVAKVAESGIEDPGEPRSLNALLLSEQENSQMLKMLEAIERRLQIPGDQRARIFEEATSPKDMVAQIDAAVEADRTAL